MFETIEGTENPQYRNNIFRPSQFSPFLSGLTAASSDSLFIRLSLFLHLTLLLFSLIPSSPLLLHTISNCSNPPPSAPPSRRQLTAISPFKTRPPLRIFSSATQLTWPIPLSRPNQSSSPPPSLPSSSSLHSAYSLLSRLCSFSSAGRDFPSIAVPFAFRLRCKTVVSVYSRSLPPLFLLPPPLSPSNDTASTAYYFLISSSTRRPAPSPFLFLQPSRHRPPSDPFAVPSRCRHLLRLGPALIHRHRRPFPLSTPPTAVSGFRPPFSQPSLPNSKIPHPLPPPTSVDNSRLLALTPPSIFHQHRRQLSTLLPSIHSRLPATSQLLQTRSKTANLKLFQNISLLLYSRLKLSFPSPFI